MPNLPKSQFSRFIALVSEAKLKTSHFPNIFRFIPEEFSHLKALKAKFLNLRIFKLSISSLVSGVLLIAATNQSLLLLKNREQLKKISSERSKIEKEVNLWKKTVGKFQNYPDIYFKIASLEYRLGNTKIAKNFIDKALAINPDAEQGRVLGEKISRK